MVQRVKPWREARNVTVIELFSHERTYTEWEEVFSSNINQKNKVNSAYFVALFIGREH